MSYKPGILQPNFHSVACAAYNHTSPITLSIQFNSITNLHSAVRREQIRQSYLQVGSVNKVQKSKVLTSIPWAVRLSWLEMPVCAHFFRRAILTHKVGQTGLVFGMRSGFISPSVHARLQVSACSGYDLFHPG